MTTVALSPRPAAAAACPYCGIPLEVEGWLVPGMRNLAETRCPSCRRRYYEELPAGHAVHTPLLLEADGGAVHGAPAEHWSAQWLGDAYASRSLGEVRVDAEELRAADRPVLLNTVDALYGHALLKLLNAQPALDAGAELVVLVQRELRWAVPDGVAAIWTVDLPLARGAEWNDALAARVRELVGDRELALLAAAPHPHPRTFAIERFSRVTPFPLGEWNTRPPAVTFVWRGDRTWSTRRPLERGRRRGTDERQRANVVALADALRDALPGLSYAVAGIGAATGLPPWIDDARVERPDAAAERRLCELYAASHVVVGVHGSNMLLPSAHAGAVVELMPTPSWGNVVQDLLPRGEDVREALYRYRVLPSSTRPAEVAAATASLIVERTSALKGIGP